MIIVQGTYRLDPGEREAYLTQSADSMRIARGEHGCLEYVVAPDPIEPDRVVLSERWATMDDLDEHVRAIIRRRQEAADRGDAPGVAVASQEITVYEVASHRRMA